MLNITKEKIQTYEDIRQSGVTNMYQVKNVMQLSGLAFDECVELMKNYDHYIEKFKITKL
jgi:hypothetical protein